MNVSSCDASDTQFSMTETTMSPLSASFSTVVASYFAENQTLVYQSAVEFPPLTITKGTIIGLIIGLSVGKAFREGVFLICEGAAAFIGLAVAAVYYYKKTRREERKRFQNWKLGTEDESETPLINQD